MMTSALALVNEDETTINTEPQPQNHAVLYSKIARVLGGVARIKKNGFNKFHNYAYATDADIYDGIRPLLAEQNIAFISNMLGYEQKDQLTSKGGTITYTRVKMQYIFACGETGATISSVWWGESQDTDDKGINKASKTALKYFLINFFQIATGDVVDDPDSGVGGGQKQPKIMRKPDTGKPAQNRPAASTAPTSGNSDPATDTAKSDKQALDAIHQWVKVKSKNAVTLTDKDMFECFGVDNFPDLRTKTIELGIPKAEDIAAHLIEWTRLRPVDLEKAFPKEQENVPF